MDVYVIGKFCDENGYSEAFKLYDKRTKKTKIVAKNDIKKAMADHDMKIGGLQVITKTFDTDHGFVTVGIKVQVRKSMYNIFRLEEIDGNGYPKEKPNVFVLMGYYKFGVDRIFQCVDASGAEHLLDYELFMEKVKKNEIIGATYRNNKLAIYKDNKNQLYV